MKIINIKIKLHLRYLEGPKYASALRDLVAQDLKCFLDTKFMICSDCGALRDSVAFAQFKKHENPWRSVTFSKFTPP